MTNMSLSKIYNPERDIPDLSGKVFFITGGTSGLGRETILQLSKHKPACIYFTGRNAKNAESVVSEVKTVNPQVEAVFVACDQTSLESVYNAANSVLAMGPKRLDALICNAGIMGGLPGLTKDGYEVQFGVNYLAHALFVKCFLHLLKQTAATLGDARIVFLVSVGFRYTPSGGILFKDLKTTQENIPLGMMMLAAKWQRYGQSKLALVLLSTELAKSHPELTSVSLHPGVIHTGLVTDQPTLDRWFVKLTTFGKEITLGQGTWNTLWAATTSQRDKIESGGIYEPVGVRMEPSKDSSNGSLRYTLTQWTETALKVYGSQ